MGLLQEWQLAIVQEVAFHGGTSDSEEYMNVKPKIGLLPLYIALYDKCAPECRARFTPFLDRIRQGFATERVDVVQAGICTVEAEAEEAIGRFEREKVDLIVTIHLAYSPSLESVGALAATRLPIARIARRVGYRDVSRFGQHFKRRFRATPRQWRARRT